MTHPMLKAYLIKTKARLQVIISLITVYLGIGMIYLIKNNDTKNWRAYATTNNDYFN
jgi:hypothetical protein